MIRTWFGPLPNWTTDYLENVKPLRDAGWDFLIVNDFDAYCERVERILGVRPTERAPGTRKCGDWDPMIGELFAEELQGYDFWGHVGLDCVFGRLERYLPDQLLNRVDVFGNDPDAICGPFSLYRNTPLVNSLFRRFENWREVIESDHFYGFDETEFNVVVRKARDAGDIRFQSAFWQSHDKQRQHLPKPKLKLLDDGTLMDTGINREIMMFHFNRKDIAHTWPVSY